MSLRSSPSFAAGGIDWNPETDTLILPPWGWACFHCGERFPATYVGQRNARRHFGEKPTAPPACILEETQRA